MKKKLLGLLVATMIIGGALAVYSNRQFIRDYYLASTHELGGKATLLADDIELTSKGMMIFKASQSQVQSAADFNKSCRGVHEELTIVLGCYSDRKIFIYDITDERLDGAKEVTAAHELLHAVYDRLSEKERERVDQLMKVEVQALGEGKIRDTLGIYEKATPSHLRHETYAILGTELKDMSDELEEHFAQFFKNRQTIVTFSKQYNDVFTAIESKIRDYDNKLTKLMSQKTALEKKLQTYKNQLQQSNNRLSSLRDSGDISGYNSQVVTHNQVVSRHNATITQLRSIVSKYNDIVDKRNNIAVTQNDLTKQLDSNYKVVD